MPPLIKLREKNTNNSQGEPHRTTSAAPRRARKSLPHCLHRQSDIATATRHVAFAPEAKLITTLGETSTRAISTPGRKRPQLPSFLQPTAPPFAPAHLRDAAATQKQPAVVPATSPALRKLLLFGPPLKSPETSHDDGSKPNEKHHYLKKHVEKCKRQKLDNQDPRLGETNSINTNKQQRDNTISNIVASGVTPGSWKSELPTAPKLRSTKFGQSTVDISATQEACRETTLYLLLQSGYLEAESRQAVLASHPLIAHLDRVSLALSDYDFRWIRETDTAWASQTSIPNARRQAMMACLFHYNLDVSLVMRFLGGNHTAAHRDVQSVATILLAHKVPKFLVQQYVRVMTVGCPNSINADVSRENALQYWRKGNNPSVKANMALVKETMNKEDRNKFVIPL